jgi:two-component sensor histidine kinase
MGPYLATLCAALAQSMISDNRAVSIKFSGSGGICTSRAAESIGLIVTELVINSLKHAFDETTKDGAIIVAYDVSGTDWQLVVSDNGSGKPDCLFAQPKAGLGTDVVKSARKTARCSSGDSKRRYGNKGFGYSRDICGPRNLRRPTHIELKPNFRSAYFQGSRPILKRNSRPLAR